MTLNIPLKVNLDSLQDEFSKKTPFFGSSALNVIIVTVLSMIVSETAAGDSVRTQRDCPASGTVGNYGFASCSYT